MLLYAIADLEVMDLSTVALLISVECWTPCSRSPSDYLGILVRFSVVRNRSAGRDLVGINEAKATAKYSGGR